MNTPNKRAFSLIEGLALIAIIFIAIMLCWDLASRYQREKMARESTKEITTLTTQVESEQSTNNMIAIERLQQVRFEYITNQLNYIEGRLDRIEAMLTK